MYFIYKPCTDPDLRTGLTFSFLAQTICICPNCRSCCSKLSRQIFINKDRSGFSLNIFHSGKQLLRAVTATKKRNISKSKAH